MEGKNYSGIKKDEKGQYVYTSEKQKRTLGERNCTRFCTIGKKCASFSDEERSVIFDRFWINLNWEQKRFFVAGLVDRVEIKERRKTTGESRKKCSFRYFLKKNDQRLPVCRNMMLSTLGLKDKMVYEWMKDVRVGVPDKTPDKRRNTPRTDSKVSAAKEFLGKLPNLPSHYCRASSKKKYLEPLFTTFSDLYRVYKQYCSSESVGFLCKKAFKSCFDELNLSLSRPKKDQSDICCGFEAGNISEIEYNNHINMKNEARNEKSRDKARAECNGRIKVITLDLQSLLLSPRIQASSMYYKTKLGCQNYTVYDLVTRDVVCYFWHEGEGELSANSFASCLADYINNLTGITDELVIFNDGCTYQNRNAILSNTLLKLSKDKNITIVQKFLEKGHTQMECDSVHSTIERRLRNKPIYVPQNYVDLIGSARVTPLYNVKYLSSDFFKKYSELNYYSSIRPGRGSGDPVVTNIRVLQYKDGAISYKLRYSDEFEDLPRRRNSEVTETDIIIPNLYDDKPKIKTKKYSHLQELKAVIPKDYHSFYDCLAHE